MAALDPAIQRAIRAWLEVDPDPATRAELEELLSIEAHDELSDRFGSRMAFGTSGIRGPLGAGPNRMNRVTLRRMVAGLMRVLGPGARVVIGRDARTNSAVFASDAAMMVAAYGGHAVVIGGANPTPVLAYAVRAVKADAGLMVTASHNPPADNGCKVFWSDGVQLRSPNDQKIELEIEDVGLPPAEIVTRVEGGSIEDAPASLVADYLASIVPVRSSARDDEQSIRVVYTPLHGVGSELLLSAFARAGLAEPHVVASQQQPDAAFPTVAFPNPEEPGALDLAFALANQVGGDLIVANDPDADRLSISIPDASADHGWRTLTGDEVGALLVDRLIGSNEVTDPLVVSTVVCSRLVQRIAESRGVAHESTLTGFKWIAGAAFRNPERFLFCYEESLGYAVTGAVRDKDGISAAIEFVKLAADLSAAGSSVAGRLAELAAEHGLHTTKQVSVRFRGPGAVARAGAAVDRLRITATSELGGRSIEQRKDYQEGNGLPPTNLLRFELHGNVRVMLRPSGTEAKTKIYLEKVTPVADPSAVPATQAAALEELDQLASVIEAALLEQ